MDDSRWSAFSNTRDGTGSRGSPIAGLIVLDDECLLVKTSAVAGVLVGGKVDFGITIVELGF
jgi:hypothetical protein